MFSTTHADPYFLWGACVPEKDQDAMLAPHLSTGPYALDQRDAW